MISLLCLVHLRKPFSATLNLNRKPDWNRDRNPLVTAGVMYGKLLPAFLAAGALSTFGVLSTATVSNGIGSNFQEIVGSFIGFLLPILFLSAGTAITGGFSLVVVVLFDWSFGKLFSLKTIAAASVGMSVIPIALMGIILHAFSNYPNSNFFIYPYFVLVIAIGCICGRSAWAHQVPEMNRKEFQFNIRHLFVATAWIGLCLAIGAGNAAIPIAIYVTVVALVVKAYSIRHGFGGKAKDP